MATWSVYPVVGLTSTGRQPKADEKAVKWQVRWRVEGVLRKRTFSRQGHAKQFHDRLTSARINDWHADLRGYPVDPTSALPTPASTTATETPSSDGAEVRSALRAGLSFADYCLGTWWPINESRFNGKNKLGHRRNMRVAVELMTYQPGDPRLDGRPGTGPHQSILLRDLVADDVRRVLVRRRSVNGRTAAQNQRTLAKPRSTDGLGVVSAS